MLKTEAIILFISTLIALLLVKLSGKFIPYQERAVKTRPIDGLRGYLALFVFVYHAFTFQHNLQTGKAIAPASLFPIGPDCVWIFFMISAFLFIGKAKKGIPDWKYFYFGRFLRLAPLYLFSAFLCIAVSLYGNSSIASLKELISISTLKNLISWLSLGMVPATTFNNSIWYLPLNGSVYWSLCYEWLLYFSIPLIAKFILKKRVNWKIISITVFLITLLTIENRTMIFGDIVITCNSLYFFICGGVIVTLSSNNKIELFAFQRKASYIVLVLLFLFAISIALHYTNVYLIFLPPIFLLIASGTDLLGILSNKLSCKFGQLSYSLYLLHGITFYTYFILFLGVDRSKHLTDIKFFCNVFVCEIIVLTLSAFTHRYIEEPFIQSTRFLYDKYFRKNGAIELQG
jgi:peptidoglycan/LPS O-acetylase OafA/YrhL